MSSNPAIRTELLSKQYRITSPHERVRYRTLRDALMEGVQKVVASSTGRRSDSKTSFWALRGIDLAVDQGEVVGVIGRNGSGKSTLLKILTGIVEPTEGRAEIRGRVASLLEVGTGFHAELTGRDNVFLNGAILGMSRTEVQRKFDQIVEFAGVAKFIDTPVKRYSSGMYTRLAFSVAAHVDPDVLIVDEVLAVGDAEFQQKCMGRMRDVGQAGRTVLFVSHNMGAVESLCTRCVLLDGGRLINDGVPHEVAREYRRTVSRADGKAFVEFEGCDGARRQVRILRSAYVADEHGDATTSVPVGRPFELRLGVRIPEEVGNLVFVVRIDSAVGQRVLTLIRPREHAGDPALRGECELACYVTHFPPGPGVYKIGLAVVSHDQMTRTVDEIGSALSFTVVNAEVFNSGHGAPAGVCVADARWTVCGPIATSSSVRLAEAARPDAVPVAEESIR